MEPVEVTASFDLGGVITPHRFTWQQVDYPVASVGRRWMDEAGQHILVMVPGDRVFELLYEPPTGLWYLRRIDVGSSIA